MTVTIKDIAKKVGVNPSTVSRVINGTASISEETKDKIFAAMKEMDYHPNSLARSLVNGYSFTIGLVIDAGNSDAFSNTFFIQSVSAIEKIAQQKGYNVLITNDADSENGNLVRNLILEHKVDGLILPVSSTTEALIELLIQHELPFVVMGEPETNADKVCWVDMDNEQGSRLAVRHLLEAGYQHPVLCVEKRRTVFEKKRISGFKKELAHNHISCCKKDIIECGMEEELAVDKIKAFIAGNEEADSIICTNNIVAYHVLHELKKGGISVPEAMGVVTFDNYPLAQYMEPALTVVDIDTYLLGEQAAVILFDKIKKLKREEKNILIPTKMIIRQSTKRRKE